MPELRVLYLQGNDIQQIDGLDGCPQLRELVLDRNKIKKLDPRAFVNIQVFRLEGSAGCLFAWVFEDIMYYLGL
jgi:Leucine-rich repeat (LRR) protein